MEQRKREKPLRVVSAHSYPRWLGYSRLAEVMDGAATWPVLQALVMLDHQTMGLVKRRRDIDGLPTGFGFAVPTADIAAHTGITEKTILQRAVPELLERGLLAHYEVGRGGRAGYRWPQFALNPDTLIEVFISVASRLRIMHGGYADVGVDLIADEGLQIYGRSDERGWPMPPGVVIVPFMRLMTGPKPAEERIDLGDLERICARVRQDTVSSQ